MNGSEIFLSNSNENDSKKSEKTLWQLAYDKIDEDLREKYHRILDEACPNGTSIIKLGCGGLNQQCFHDVQVLTIKSDRATVNTDQQKLHESIIENARQDIDEKSKARDSMGKIGEGVQKFKVFIDQAVKVSPEASLVWAGISVVLPLLMNPKIASDACRDGFDYVTFRLGYYIQLEKLLLSPENEERRPEIADLWKKVCETWIELYKQMLQFQMKSVIRFRGDRNIVKDMWDPGDWTKDLDRIKALETSFDKDIRQINDSLSCGDHKKISDNTSWGNKLIEKLQKLVQELLKITSSQLDVQREILARLTPQEHNCLHLFRLTSNDADESYEGYKNGIQKRLDGTCKWFLKQPSYTKWLGQDSGPLIVSADPGCGKSVLAKYLIDSRFGGAAPSSTICYFFFKDVVQNKQKQALCALIHQLLSAQPSLIKHALPAFENNGNHLVNVLDTLWEILTKIITDPEVTTKGPLVIVLDALDECSDSEIGHLIDNIKGYFLSRDSTKVKFLLTTRPYDNIVTEFNDLVERFPHIRIPGEDESEMIAKEVNIVIKYRVDRLVRKHRLSPEIKKHLLGRLLKIPHRTYLWVHLVFHYFETNTFEKIKKGVDKVIDNIPQDLHGAYHKILERSGDKVMARKAFCIILASYRPLTIAEMNMAVHLDLDTEKHPELESDENFAISLRNWCGLLVSVNDKKIHLLHQTTREFLVQEGFANASDQIQPITEVESHSILAKSCITSIHSTSEPLSKDLESWKVDLRELNLKENQRFLVYSSQNWFQHVHDAGLEKEESLVLKVEQICNPNTDVFFSWVRIYNKGKRRKIAEKGVNTLWIAAYTGMAAVVAKLLKKGFEDVEDSSGRNTLIAATENSYTSVIELLLQSDKIHKNVRDIYKRTPLHSAVEAGSYSSATVRMLLDRRDINVISRDKNGLTPFIIALGTENGELIETFLDSDRAPDACNAKDGKGDTPFAHFIQSHKKSYSWSESRKKYIYCPMQEKKDTGLISLLLQHKNINVNRKNSDGSTALHYFVPCCGGDVLDLFLSVSINVDIPDKDGTTPFMKAAFYGDHQAFQKLLATGKVDPNRKDAYGRTALFLATLNGQSSMVKALLNIPVDAEIPDRAGKTPLMCAVEYREKDIVELILKKCRVDVNKRDTRDMTALSYARMPAKIREKKSDAEWGLKATLAMPDNDDDSSIITALESFA